MRALEHERIPFVSYPYEWTFSMLKDAALVHLDLLLAALDAELTMKDGYAYNLAFTGSRPVFIDIGSFERVRPGEPWAGYRQFCQTMLYPLLLQAHKDVRFQPWLRGAIQGIQPQDLAKLFTGTDKMKPGVLKHVSLHGAMDQRYSKSRAQDTQKELKAAGFSTELQKATVSAIRKLVAKLEWSRSASEWNDYQRTSTYTDAEREIKAAFVAKALEGKGARLVFDLGGNDGTYSRVAAAHADYVVCADGDDLVLDGLYRSLRQEGNRQILPAYLDLSDPPRASAGGAASAPASSTAPAPTRSSPWPCSTTWPSPATSPWPSWSTGSTPWAAAWWSSSSTRPTRWPTASWPTSPRACTATTAARSSSASSRPASTSPTARSSPPAPAPSTTPPRAASLPARYDPAKGL